MADAKQKKEVYALVALVVAAALIWYFQFAKRPSVTGFSVDNGTYTPINARDFGDVIGDMDKARSTEYKSTGRNIFVMGALPAAPGADPNVQKAVIKRPYEPQGPHEQVIPLPTLSMKFFGYGNLPSGGPRQAFLLDGDDVRIVSEGDTLQNHIRILKIGNESIEFEDINTHKHNSNPLEFTATSPAA